MPSIPACAASPDTLPSEADIRAILTERIDVQRQSSAIVVGLVGPTSTRTVAHGAYSAADPRAPDANTLFKIASITKMFTAVLLADAVHRGEMRFDDPVARHLPETVSLPAFGGKPITLLDLATHTSGLPILPEDYPAETDPEGRARYTNDQLFAFLKTYQLRTAPGTRWSYSNLNYELLGIALAHRAGLSYEALLEQRITSPLGMADTTLHLSAAQAKRLAPGHDLALHPLAPEPDAIMSRAAGGLYSTAQDLMIFLSACMGSKPTALAPAFAAMLDRRRPNGTGQQGIGPQITGEGAKAQIGHSGATPGYSSSLLWAPDRFGVVVLSNGSPPVLDIAAHLLDPRLPLAKPVRAIAVDAQALARFVGKYRSNVGLIFDVTQGANGLAFEAVGGAPKVDLTPESAGVFTVPRLGARISFEGEGPAPPKTIRVEYFGTTYTGIRID